MQGSEIEFENRKIGRTHMIKQSTVSHPRVSSKLPAFTDKENTDAYLTIFERYTVSGGEEAQCSGNR